MKKMVHTELQDHGDFGLADVKGKIFFLHFLLFSYLKKMLKKLYSLFIIVGLGR